MDQRKVAVLLAAGVPVALALWLLQQRKSRRRKQEYGDLDGAVSFSSRLVAALRAIESQKEDRLIEDPLAACLAGPVAMAHALEYSKVWGVADTELRDGELRLRDDDPAAGPLQNAEERQAGDPASGKLAVGRLAVRTFWFDHRLEEALEAAGAAASDGRRQQVVALGAGMDSRPWRHKYLRDVEWFEIDRSDVLAAKDRALQAAGAQTFADGASACKYPLRARRRTTLEVDLSGSGWVLKLQAAGFDPQSPTVWIAEGLLMYLEPEAVASLLEETSAASAPGSTLLTQAFVEGYRMRDNYGPPKPGAFGSLQSSFHWFCQPDPAPFFREHGWPKPAISTYAKMAAETGRPGNAFSAEMHAGGFHDRLCPFIAATL